MPELRGRSEDDTATNAGEAIVAYNDDPIRCAPVRRDGPWSGRDYMLHVRE